MATKKISELPLVERVSGSQVAGGSVLPIVIGGGLQGTTNQISVENFSKFVTQYSAHTGSAGNTFTGPQTINNNVTINGKLTVTEIVAQYETASVIFSSGSNIFGDKWDDVHTFTGSLILNGASLNNSFLRIHQATASLQIFTASQETKNLVLSIVTGSINQATASLQTFTASQADRNLVLSIVTGSINQATASIQFQTASLLTFTASQDSRNFTLSQVTGSFNYFYQATASLQTFTASQADRNLVLSTVTGSINQATASLQTFTASQADRNLVLSIVTGSINQATASLQFYSASVEAQLARIQQATASLQTFTASQADRNLVLSIVTGSINQATASIQFQTASLLTFTASQDSRNFTLSQVTGSFRGEIGGLEAYSASLKAAAIVSSSTQIQNYDIFGLNSNLYRATGSLIGITNGLMAFTAALDNTYATDAQLYQLYQSTASLQFQTASLLQFTASEDSRNFTLSQVTGSFRGEIGGIEAYTASLKAATIVSSSTQIFTGYDYEIHVSQVDGNDTTGNGDLLTPVATITKALQIVSSSYLSTDRRTIIIHPGTYTESPTVTLANTYIFALGLLGANTVIAGTLTINAACRVSGIKMTNLVVNTTAAVYINNTTVDTQMTVTNTGYLETTGCSFQCTSGVTVSGAAPGVVFNSTTLWGLVVSNASAIVVVRNSPQVVVATVTAGNLALSNTLLYSSTPTGNAITTSAGSVVTLSNLNILDNTALAVARVSLSGFYSIIDVVYDKPNSTLVALSGTGGPLNAIDYFQYINADKFITQGGTGYQFLKGDGSLDSTMPSSLQQTTASLNLTTGSLIGITNGLMDYTASLKNVFSIDGNNDVYFTGKITAQEVHTTFTTSSVLFQSGSSKFGNSSDDKHDFTGSLNATGSLTVNGKIYSFLNNLEILRNGTGTPQTVLLSDSTETTLMNNATSARLAFRVNSIDYGRFVPTTGNFLLQNGGTFTDNGSRLQVIGSGSQNALYVSGSSQFTGSLLITGSIFISGSVYANTTSQSVASNTASLDFTAANFFMVQLGSSVTTHISASNLRAGQSVNVLVTTGTNSTASFSTNVRQPSGSFYLPTSGSGNKDVLSFVSFDSSNLYLVAVNQMI